MVDPTSFRRRVLKGWKRVWCEPSKSCKEDEKGKRLEFINRMTQQKRRRQNEQGGLPEKKLENLDAGKSEAKNKHNPQRMLQTVNGLCKPIKMQQMSVGRDERLPFDNQKCVEQDDD